MTPAEASKQARDVCALAPVIPVLTVPDASKAEGLARALVAGGLPALEVTLRTPAALDAIREMAKVDGGVVGAGTLMTFSPDPRKNPGVEDLVKTFRDKGIEPEGYVLYTYAAIQAWAQAATAAGSVDYDAVSKALNDGDFTTVLGDLSFDDKGDVTLPGYVFYEWKDGTYDYLN